MLPPFMDSATAANAAVTAATEDAQAALGVGYASFGYCTQQQSGSLSPSLCERMMRCENAKEVQEIQVGLEQLVAEPGEFETWASAIRERTSKHSFKVEALKITIDMITQLAHVIENQ
ncbi:unnamed protein product [Gongylonema pulchrum]|uniref:Uncharacterized protein n=1 Tax=Gongylonema pulchrum TaxID=637853 RepID=A0A3P6RH79_9BILA|nr:unnamed protein product [Gongylonema pulchrum]